MRGMAPPLARAWELLRKGRVYQADFTQAEIRLGLGSVPKTKRGNKAVVRERMHVDEC